MKSLKDESGQGMVEYILLIVVIFSIMKTLFPLIEGYLISDRNSFINRYLNVYEEELGQGGIRGQYRRFRVTR